MTIIGYNQLFPKWDAHRSPSGRKRQKKIISDSNLKSSCRHANQPVPIKFSGQFTSKDLVFLKETYIKPLLETSIKAQERSWDDWRFDLRMNFGSWALGPWGVDF